MDIGTLHLTRPLWLLCLLPVTLTLALMVRHWRSGGNWRSVMEPALMIPLMERSTGSHWLPVTGLALCWCLAALALAGPAWERTPQALRQSREALVLVLDTSLSMRATDLPPSRIERARDKLSDILTLRHDGLYALIAYADDAYVITPMTDDSETVRNLVQVLSPDIMPTSGSNPIPAIKRALELLHGSQLHSGRVILLTDGIASSDVMPLARLIDGTGIELGILGVGTPHGSPVSLKNGGQLRDANGRVVRPRLGRTALQQLSAQTGGLYREVTLDNSDIEALLEHSRPVTPTTQATERQVDHWQEFGAVLVLAMLPLALSAFRRGWMAVVALGFMGSLMGGLAPPAAALEGGDWWRSPDQRGKRLLEQGQATEAAAQFRDPAWRATALHHAGKHHEAAALWGEHSTPDAHYNRGNALARQGLIEEAMASYQSALDQRPDMEDAQANLDLLRTLSEQERNEVQQQAEESEERQSGEEEAQGQQSSDSQQAQEGQAGQQEASNDEGQQLADTDSDADQADNEETTGATNETVADEEDATDERSTTGDEQNAEHEAEVAEEALANGAETGDEDSNAEEQSAQERLAALERQREAERERETDLWLRQVPEGAPNTLLRNKLYLEHRRRQQSAGASNRDPW